MSFSPESLEDPLAVLGELLTDRGNEVEAVAIGGGSLLLLGLIEPKSKHAVDLAKPKPSPKELTEAAAWCKTHDPSEGFAEQLELALQALGGERGR